MVEISSTVPEPSVRELLSYATSIKKVDKAYKSYIQSANQQLFGYVKEQQTVGCIGIEINAQHGVIKHIAVSPEERGKGIGGQMIAFLSEQYSFATVSAETDKDAVAFYRSLGFVITSLGEKYEGVERFLCVLSPN
ncbi:N-acetyltransferase [Paenibacillaceae bacterium]|nr:N-acetyltransferase [Paenibacillaceae bacterium]